MTLVFYFRDGSILHKVTLKFYTPQRYVWLKHETCDSFYMQTSYVVEPRLSNNTAPFLRVRDETDRRSVDVPNNFVVPQTDILQGSPLGIHLG
jgi:hypothetical protein